MRRWQPKSEKVNQSEQQLGVEISGVAEHMSLRYILSHNTGHWLLVLEYSNAFNTVKRRPFSRRWQYDHTVRSKMRQS